MADEGEADDDGLLIISSKCDWAAGLSFSDFTAIPARPSGASFLSGPIP